MKLKIVKPIQIPVSRLGNCFIQIFTFSKVFWRIHNFKLSLSIKIYKVYNLCSEEEPKQPLGARLNWLGICLFILINDSIFRAFVIANNYMATALKNQQEEK